MKKNMLIKSIQLTALYSLFSLSTVTLAEETSSDNVLVTVNDTHITKQIFELYGEKRIGAPLTENFPEEKRKEFIEELISRELIYQDAVKGGLDKDEKILLEIQEQIHNLITRAKINKLLEDNPPSETVMKSIYQAQIVDPASSEYKASHILSEDIDTARSVIESLNKGGDFATLAKEKSIGPSATEGGDLGWFSPNQMVKPFSDAVEQLKDGEYTKRPIKTRFGWHVIKLAESRKVDPPTFESVEAQVLQVAQNKIISDYLKSLRENAKIDVK